MKLNKLQIYSWNNLQTELPQLLDAVLHVRVYLALYGFFQLAEQLAVYYRLVGRRVALARLRHQIRIQYLPRLVDALKFVVKLNLNLLVIFLLLLEFINYW